MCSLEGARRKMQIDRTTWAQKQINQLISNKNLRQKVPVIPQRAPPTLSRIVPFLLSSSICIKVTLTMKATSVTSVKYAEKRVDCQSVGRK